MSKKLYEESNIQAIAAAIREKNGTQNTYTTAQMANAVRAITTQPNLETLSVNQNGRYLPSAGKDGFSEVAVNVQNSYTNSDEGKVVKNGELIAQTARATSITENGTYDTTENDEVTVNVSSGGGSGAVVQPLSATQNGTYNPPSGVDGYAPVTVNVSGGGGDIDPIIESLVSICYVSFSQKNTSDINNYMLGIDTIGFASGTRGNGAAPFVIENYSFSDIMSLFDSQYILEYYTNTGSTGTASALTSDILSKSNAVLLGNITGEGDLNDSIENYKRILLFGSYNSEFNVSAYDVGMSYPVITLGTPYMTGVKDRNTSYRATVIFTSNSHVTAKSNVDGTGSDRRVRIYGIP